MELETGVGIWPVVVPSFEQRNWIELNRCWKLGILMWSSLVIVAQCDRWYSAMCNLQRLCVITSTINKCVCAMCVLLNDNVLPTLADIIYRKHKCVYSVQCTCWCVLVLVLERLLACVHLCSIVHINMYIRHFIATSQDCFDTSNKKSFVSIVPRRRF